MTSYISRDWHSEFTCHLVNRRIEKKNWLLGNGVEGFTFTTTQRSGNDISCNTCGSTSRPGAGTFAVDITYLSCGYPRFTTLAED